MYLHLTITSRALSPQCCRSSKGVNPFRTAVPFWGHPSQIPSTLSPNGTAFLNGLVKRNFIFESTLFGGEKHEALLNPSVNSVLQSHLGGQSTHDLIGLSPKRDYSPKRTMSQEGSPTKKKYAEYTKNHCAPSPYTLSAAVCLSCICNYCRNLAASAADAPSPWRRRASQ